MYVIGTGRDEHGKPYYYFHMKGYPYIPVFGSIGTYGKAKKVCDMYNLKERKK